MSAFAAEVQTRRAIVLEPAPAVAQAQVEFVDVLRVNQYEWDRSALEFFRSASLPFGYVFTGDAFADLDEIARLTAKPMMITEFSYRAADSGLPNSFPPVYEVLATQAERADRYESYMDRVLARPYLVGAHWFEYVDEPAEGRFDGENDNFGIVDIRDDEYAELAERMRAVNTAMYATRIEAR